MQIVATARRYGCYTYLLAASVNTPELAIAALESLPSFDRYPNRLGQGIIDRESGRSIV
ncbi:hypothetical protein [Chamaesiphon sp. VAR_69_metabat_338]|uniref:hypothetical protein n=1 Tax=Chamaesiphon sp. VAR_69_metabat_338 TaxID=2964704 RepID=UPI00286D9208|nr:hypothetical protein [Chamaesiphon sp. VAR_69_metabat_338]